MLKPVNYAQSNVVTLSEVSSLTTFVRHYWLENLIHSDDDDDGFAAAVAVADAVAEDDFVQRPPSRIHDKMWEVFSWIFKQKNRFTLYETIVFSFVLEID